MHICTGLDLVNMVYKCEDTIYYSLVNFCNYSLIKIVTISIFVTSLIVK
jgi:hypothetical protein